MNRSGLSRKSPGERVYQLDDGTLVGEFISIEAIRTSTLASGDNDLREIAEGIARVKANAWTESLAGDSDRSYEEIHTAVLETSKVKHSSKELVKWHLRAGNTQVARLLHIGTGADADPIVGWTRHKPVWDSALQKVLGMTPLRTRPDVAYLPNLDTDLPYMGVGSAMLHAALDSYPRDVLLRMDILTKNERVIDWLGRLGLHKTLDLGVTKSAGNQLEQSRYEGPISVAMNYLSARVKLDHVR